MLLDEARDQYQSLMVQVKNSNTKALQQKCVFLQRNLEQMTAVQQQVCLGHSRLKKIGYQREQSIEARKPSLHEATCYQKRKNFWPGASSHRCSRKIAQTCCKVCFLGCIRFWYGSDDIPGKSGSFKAAPQARKNGMQATLNTSGGRIAKPIRGGGVGGSQKMGEVSSLTNTGSMNSYGSSSGSQVWWRS